ncbi:putative methyltransferase-domain-containing protein [Phaeosphaeria sp. MPI-PUGE-AT-0046c]|nr:putative methyltransferase-domain-containing protein [Phaeosphaeria sp. MPI-PUGE-AT-0046c]
MRYIRFLKPPRVIVDKSTSKSQISCLITITSDLGDSFLPYDLELAAELLSLHQTEEAVVWRTVQWKSGMRSLPVTFPLAKNLKAQKFRIRVGGEPKSTFDDYGKLSREATCGVVSAWSQEFDPSAAAAAAKLVDRRFKLMDGCVIRISEETGESIARHLWDAGITLSCHVSELLKRGSQLAEALLSNGRPTQLRILELGTGCGMVGLALAHLIQDADVLLTDLPEAQEIVEHNINQTKLAKGSTLKFQTLDWDDDLPQDLQSSCSPFDMVLAADCTYNPDSSPALVQTLRRLCKVSPQARVAIAMKMRHLSEEVFFDLMAEADFMKITTLEYPLPGDVEIGEEAVFLHVYQYKPSM